MIEDTGYVAVRKDYFTNRFWIDFDTFSGDLENTKKKAKLDEERIPDFCKANPVQGYCSAFIQVSLYDKEE